MKSRVNTVEEYFASIPPEAKKALQELRDAILEAAPEAEEYISYQMPAFRLNGPLLYIGAFTNHCSLFPGNSKLVEQQFPSELKNYITSKGTIQFPIGKPLPTALIRKIVKARVEDNRERAAAKKKVIGKV